MLSTFLFLVCIGSFWSVGDAESSSVSSVDVIHTSIHFEDSSNVLSSTLHLQTTSPLSVFPTMKTELLFNDSSSSEVFHINTKTFSLNDNGISSSSVIDIVSSSPGINLLSSSFSSNTLTSSSFANASSFVYEISVFSSLDASSIIPEVDVITSSIQEISEPLSETNVPLSLTLDNSKTSILASFLEEDIKPTLTVTTLNVPVITSSFVHSVAEDVNIGKTLSETTHLPYNTAVSNFPISSLSTDLKNFENIAESSLDAFDNIDRTEDFKTDIYISSSITSTINTLQYTELPYSSPLEEQSIVMSPSVLQESSNVPFQNMGTDVQPTEEYSNVSFSSIVIFDNESTDDVTTTPADFEHKKLLMLVLRAEDCSRLSKKDFEQMLSKLMAMYELDTIPEIQNTKCYSHLNINFTLSGSKQTIQFLPSIDGKQNLTVDFLNRTYNVIKFERVDLLLEHDRSNYSNAQSDIMAEMKQKVAFIGVAAAIIVVILVVAILWVAKCCHARRVRQRFSLYPKGGLIKLRSTDCTLAPLPRPCPVFPECYRDALSGDIYSTSSAGSGADQGFVQSFDTSIVPLDDGVRDFSPDSAQSDMKSFNLKNFGCNTLRNADSKERWSARQNKAAGGISNPTFQRF